MIGPGEEERNKEVAQNGNGQLKLAFHIHALLTARKEHWGC